MRNYVGVAVTLGGLSAGVGSFGLAAMSLNEARQWIDGGFLHDRSLLSVILQDASRGVFPPNLFDYFRQLRSEEWLRGVARDLRAGIVSRALDVLREKGAVREHATHDDARVALVRSWAEATRAGKSALLVAFRNDDVRAMNELAREPVRASGPSAIGEERVYPTDFGERTFGVGDVLVGRERAHGGVNGDIYMLAAAHRDDGRLEFVRLRDGEHVLWDLHEHRAIDHGYATTSYRSQGRTVDAVFALASSAEARRGMYVDVTRAREDVMIAYGKDEVQDFGDLLVRAQRDNGKVLVLDVVRDVNVRLEHEEEQKRRRAVALSFEQENKLDRGWRPGRG